jgi:hypothetical protein
MDDAVEKSLNEVIVTAIQDIDGNTKVDGLVLESHKTKSPAVEVEKCNDMPDAVIPVIQGRRSGRLKKDTALNIMEKGEMMARKRNLEGNIAIAKTFSALPVDELVHSAADMGVMLNSNNLATFDLFRTLELARNDVYQKQCELTNISSVDNENNPNNADDLLELDWLVEESSDPENFILIESRKKRREKKKNIKISPINPRRLNP